MTKVLIIVQARMKSTRLPGKVLKPVLGRPLLSYQIERLRRSGYAEDIVVATSTDPADDPIAELCKEMKVECFRGDEHDVLSRYYKAACYYGTDFVVRITADCPLIDATLIDRMLRIIHQHPDRIDYLSNTLWRSFPRGLDVEVFSFKVLEEAYNHATDKYDREHVTPYIKNHCSRQRMVNYLNQKGDYAFYRWTVDTPEDFKLVSQILEVLYPIKPLFTMWDVHRLLQANVDWNDINGHIEQK